MKARCTISCVKRLSLAFVLATAAIASTPEKFATSAGKLELTPIMHASLMIRAGGKVMYIDPTLGSR